MPETLSVNEGCTGRDSVLLPRGTNAAALMVLTMPIRHETAAGDKLRGRAEADKAAVRAVGGFEADTDRCMSAGISTISPNAGRPAYAIHIGQRTFLKNVFVSLHGARACWPKLQVYTVVELQANSTF